MTLQFCSECNQTREFSGDFCTICGRKFSIDDLIEKLNYQEEIIKELTLQLDNMSFIVATTCLPQYISNQSVH